MNNNIPDNAVGLCAGRHEMPVKGYIFTEVENVFDFRAMQEVADNYVRDNVPVRYAVDDSGTEIPVGGHLDVVVTGLTSLTAAVIAACAWYNVTLSLYHFDRETGGYIPQHFYGWREGDNRFSRP